MKIGIDLDGVIFDSEQDFRVYQELYDMIELKQNNKKNNKEPRFEERYNWTEEVKMNFLNRYHAQVVNETNYMPGAKEVLKLLKAEGHLLVLITARGGINKDMIKITEERFKNEGMEIFDKFYWATENKDEVCVKEHIDIMIDDSYDKCESIAKSKIKTIYLKDAPSYDLEENDYIKVLYNWGEIYRYIKELEK